MRRLFVRWTILTLLVLGLSSAVGLVLNAVIDPQKERYQSTYRSTYSPGVQPGYYRNDLQPGPQWFGNPQPAEAYDKTLFIEAITSMTSQYAFMANGQAFPNTLPNHFLTQRMAEEWARFGVYNFRGTQPNNSTIANDANIIHQELAADPVKNVPAFRLSKVNIEWMARSTNGNDVMVLARHTTIINDVSVTWYARWWLTQQYGQWRIYDVQPSGDPFRLNARIAAEKMFINTGMDRYPKGGVNAELASLTNRLKDMQRSGVRSVLNTRADGDSYGYITPIESVKAAMTTQMNATTANSAALVAEIRQDVAVWEMPLSDLMIADLNLDLKSIGEFRKKAGNHPWAFALEAKILYKQGQKEKAAESLAKGLKETPGHPVLLIEQYRETPPGERASIGERAASGATPGESLVSLYEAFFADVSEMEAIIASFRTIRPEDKTATSVLSAVRYNQGRFDEARKQFKAATAGASDESYSTVKLELAKWCALYAKVAPEVIEKQPRFQSVVQK